LRFENREPNFYNIPNRFQVYTETLLNPVNRALVPSLSTNQSHLQAQPLLAHMIRTLSSLLRHVFWRSFLWMRRNPEQLSFPYEIMKFLYMMQTKAWGGKSLSLAWQRGQVCPWLFRKGVKSALGFL